MQLQKFQKNKIITINVQTKYKFYYDIFLRFHTSKHCNTKLVISRHYILILLTFGNIHIKK